MPLNLTQKFVYETDSRDSFEKVLTTLIGVMFKEKPSLYAQMFVTKRSDSFYNGVRRIGSTEMCSSDPKGWSKPAYLHVCSVGNYESEIKEGDETFQNHAKLVKRVMENLKSADVKKFFESCGTGFDYSFNEMDGSIAAGYRLNHRPCGGWNNLDVSLCHIYYGK